MSHFHADAVKFEEIVYVYQVKKIAQIEPARNFDDDVNQAHYILAYIHSPRYLYDQMLRKVGKYYNDN